MTTIEEQREIVASAEFRLARALEHARSPTDMFGARVSKEMFRRLLAGVELRESELTAAQQRLASMEASA